jgi:hypothetical protein
MDTIADTINLLHILSAPDLQDDINTARIFCQSKGYRVVKWIVHPARVVSFRLHLEGEQVEGSDTLLFSMVLTEVV